jgi:hypothetical protein
VAITLKDLIEDRSKLATLGGDQQHCCQCGVLLQETITGKRKTPDGEACSDCYYEQLGDLVEQHPVVSGRVRRG